MASIACARERGAMAMDDDERDIRSDRRGADRSPVAGLAAGRGGPSPAGPAAAGHPRARPGLRAGRRRAVGGHREPVGRGSTTDGVAAGGARARLAGRRGRAGRWAAPQAAERPRRPGRLPRPAEPAAPGPRCGRAAGCSGRSPPSRLRPRAPAAARALGLGDVKLAAPLGAVLGAASWPALALAAVLAAVITGVVGHSCGCAGPGPPGAEVPHGPSMLAAAWLVTVATAAGGG